MTSQMPNRALMDMIEASTRGNSLSETSTQEGERQSMDDDSGAGDSIPGNLRNERSASNLFSAAIKASGQMDSRRANELIHDDTDFVFCVIDNSGSMRNMDGKIFEKDAAGRLRKRAHGSVTRWQEARHKCLQVAEYNFRRAVPAVYYLLNPQAPGSWVHGKDFITIEAAADSTSDDGSDSEAAFAGLRRMLEPVNVRGNTPLDQITRHLRQQISAEGHSSKKIGYVLFTDGQPNCKRSFETELRHMASDARGGGQTNRSLPSLFLTINLCTDEDDVVSYYNDLDQKIGNELSGMDVLDDLEAEQREVMSAGNTFVTYCQELHICRMACCHSVLGDLLDEQTLSIFHMVKLIKELLKLDLEPSVSSANNLEQESSYEPLLWLEDTDAYLKLVESKNFNVFDFYSRKSKPLISSSKVKNAIWWYRFWHETLPMYQSCRDRLADSSFYLYLRWMRIPVLLMLCVFLLRTSVARKLMVQLLTEEGEL